MTGEVFWAGAVGTELFDGDLEAALPPAAAHGVCQGEHVRLAANVAIVALDALLEASVRGVLQDHDLVAGTFRVENIPRAVRLQLCGQKPTNSSSFCLRETQTEIFIPLVRIVPVYNYGLL